MESTGIGYFGGVMVGLVKVWIWGFVVEVLVVGLSLGLVDRG